MRITCLLRAMLSELITQHSFEVLELSPAARLVQDKRAGTPIWMFAPTFVACPSHASVSYLVFSYPVLHRRSPPPSLGIGHYTTFPITLGNINLDVD